MGSLVAAVASYLAANSRGGDWLVRIEDVDTPRTVPGAADRILRTLAAFRFEWDEEVMYQSSKIERYRGALAHLVREGSVYPCSCTRRETADSASQRAPSGEMRYPGTCRDASRNSSGHLSWRVHVADEPLRFFDRIWRPNSNKSCRQL